MTKQTPSPAFVLRFTIDGQRLALPILAQVGAGLTPREHGTIRRATGLSGAEEIIRRVVAEDLEVLAVLASIAAERAGQALDLDALLSGKVGFTYDAEVPGGPPDGAEASAAAPAREASATSTIPAASGTPS